MKSTKLRITIAFAALLAMSALGIGTVQAAVINVPADQSTIQAAIDAAAAGDTIIVAKSGGPYAGHIHVTKSLTITGDPGDAAPGPGSNAPVIDGVATANSAFFIDNGVSNVTIQGFEIHNFTSSGNGIGNGISAWVGSTSNITIQDNYFHHLGYNGVLVGNDKSADTLKWGDHTNWTIKGNILETFEAYGFELTNASNSSIEDNIIHSNATWNLASTCIMVDARRNASGIVIKGNQIDGEVWPGYPAVFVFANSFETPDVNLNNVLIENNIISTTSSTATPQVRVYNYTGTGTVTGVHVHNNSLATLKNSASLTGITPALVDATCNWWGSAQGPSGAQVSEYVTYSPWRESSSLSDECNKTPPAITVPSNMTVGATSASGAVVTFAPPPSALDNVDGTRPVSCTPASGRNFQMGSTTVTCTATDLRGNKDTRSFTVTVAGTPAAPAGVWAKAGDARATVTFSKPWNASATGITYTVTSTPAGGVQTSNTSSPIIVTGLTNGTPYTFTVTATNGPKTSLSSLPSSPVTPKSLVLAAPTGVWAKAGDTTATVTFTKPWNMSAPITYTVTSSPAGGVQTSNTSSPIIVTGLTNGTPYTFTVTATKDGKTSLLSLPSNSVTPQALLPAAPRGVWAKAGDTTATVTFTKPWNMSAPGITYTVTSSPAGGLTNTGTSSPIIVTGLTNGTAYTFTVTATKDGKTSLSSLPSIAVTPKALILAAPTGVWAKAGDTTATVTFTKPWNMSAPGITYTVTSSPAGGVQTSNTSSPIIVTGLTNGTPYTFTVTATKDGKTSLLSLPSIPVTPKEILPAAPAGVWAKAWDTTATVTFTKPWNVSAPGITYTVTIIPAGGIPTVFVQDPLATSSPIIVTGLTNGTAYTFTVTATKDGKTSLLSLPSSPVTPKEW